MGASPERPVYAVAPSRCHTIPGFRAVDTYPTRSPLAVADFLAPLGAFWAALPGYQTRDGRRSHTYEQGVRVFERHAEGRRAPGGGPLAGSETA